MKPKHLKYLWKFYKDKKQWLEQGGKITREFRILSDYADSAGIVKGHYFHQDLLVARLIHDHNPKRHIDIASRIDGFVAHVPPIVRSKWLTCAPCQILNMKTSNSVKMT